MRWDEMRWEGLTMDDLGDGIVLALVEDVRWLKR